MKRLRLPTTYGVIIVLLLTLATTFPQPARAAVYCDFVIVVFEADWCGCSGRYSCGFLLCDDGFGASSCGCEWCA